MIFPKHINNNDTIGVTACSCGILDKLEKYEYSINNVKELGFNIKVVVLKGISFIL